MKKIIVLVVLSVLFTLTTVNAQEANYRMLWTEVYPDAEGKTQLLGWWTVLNPKGFLWDILTSTEGWAEIDVGFGKVHNNWVFIGLIGTDFSITDTKFNSIIPQFFIMYWNPDTKLRFQSWNQYFMAAGPNMLKLRNFGTWHGIGADFEAEFVKDEKAQFSAGPILELHFKPGILLPEAKYSFTDKSWSFKLTYFIEWLN